MAPNKRRYCDGNGTLWLLNKQTARQASDWGILPVPPKKNLCLFLFTRASRVLWGHCGGLSCMMLLCPVFQVNVTDLSLCSNCGNERI